MGNLSVEIEGLKMVYSVDGADDAPPLILVHGWGMHKGMWHTTIPTLKDRFRCIAVDLIGFGDSDIPPGVDVSIPAQAQRLLTLIDALGYEKVTLMGHSMGGQIVLYLASQLAPERVEKLINVDGVSNAQLTSAAEASLWELRLSQYVPLYLAGGRLWCHTRLYALRYCHHWFHNFDSVPLEIYQEDRYRTIQPNSHRSMVPSWRAIKACDISPYLGQITAPTLTIFGAYDNVVPLEAAHTAAKHIPNHQLELIADCGHFPMYEKTDRYIAIVKQFLDN